ncbi:hypothetical protein UFOVP1169_9 [uncultured Caudovirales phage]|uniref:Uncharacterized protein n=1 Tax=uncultured Caudovirales phage TaxID=2100421 RepID=A0A6J5QT97_9CAUD|nr:hypothetical protein UFOVP1169_9 [uncultured Caudovirales phage]
MLPNGTYTHEHDSYAAENNVNKDMVVPIFYREKHINQKKSQQAGRSVYDEYDAAKFLVPGDNTYEHRERVTDEHKRRFARQWAAYEAGKEQVNGMPLESWYKIANNPGLIEEMRALRIRSVEDLASVTDNTVTGYMWGLEWRKKAQDEVASWKAKEALVEANSELMEQMKAMAARLAELEAASAEPEKRGPGRPPKTA